MWCTPAHAPSWVRKHLTRPCPSENTLTRGVFPLKQWTTSIESPQYFIMAVATSLLDSTVAGLRRRAGGVGGGSPPTEQLSALGKILQTLVHTESPKGVRPRLRQTHLANSGYSIVAQCPNQRTVPSERKTRGYAEYGMAWSGIVTPGWVRKDRSRSLRALKHLVRGKI